MAQEKNYITPEGMAQLRAEYGALLNDERPKLVEVIAWAASNGDRSDNADYIYGKRRLRQIDARLHFLQGRMEAAQVVDPKDLTGNKVVFASTVTMTDEDGKTHIYKIVGQDEFDIATGKISWKSPVATALLGKKTGDEVKIKKPGGDEYYTIEKIEFK
jgi:transcription elongation factor GreB